MKMRRYGRAAGGPTIHANRVNGAALPDPMTLIRAYDSENNPTRPMRPSPLTASTIQGIPLDLLDRLRSFPLFLSAPDSFLTAIGNQLRPQVYQPHDYILTEGDEAKAMYWLVRGSVRVASRDGESTYAELKPGAFFGEIGVLMNIPRTATIIANMKSLVVRLNKEDLRKELPNYPEVERAIMEEAKERIAITERKKKELGHKFQSPDGLIRNGKRPRDRMDGDVEMGEAGMLLDGEIVTMNKKRKSPSPSLADAAAFSALGSGAVNIRQLLKELPLFSSLPPEILHFLGLNAQPRSYAPFTDIVKQGTPGRDVFFIARGEVEVVSERQDDSDLNSSDKKLQTKYQVKARLKVGQYFGEVTSLSLAPRRTATVRSINAVECLVISGDVLNELWRKCSPDLRRQVERVARERLRSATDPDVTMADAHDPTPAIHELEIADFVPRTPRKKSVPTVTFSDNTPESPVTPSRREERDTVMEPSDPDPFLNIDLENMRSRSRRNSLAPPIPSSTSSETASTTAPETPKSPSSNGRILSSVPVMSKHDSTPPEPVAAVKRPKVMRRPSRFGKGIFPDPVLVEMFKHFDVYELMRARLVSMHWLKILTTSPEILHELDLTRYNRKVTDTILAEIICPFVGHRPRVIDISNCFHLTDEGFATLASSCGENVKAWKMKSVWDITGPAILEMVNKSKGLEEVDLSNCRKVGDNLLMRVVGWVVPNTSAFMIQQQQQQQQLNQQQPNGRKGSQHRTGLNLQTAQNNAMQQPAPGTVIGCPRLKRLTLSYCKHITDRSMAHIAVHASNRLESIDLTRCTTITDQGFSQWSVYPFPLLRKLILADCTYLTDNAIVYLTNAAKNLRELDLVSASLTRPLG
jgi:F-box and leucine-rich repeat protein 7